MRSCAVCNLLLGVLLGGLGALSSCESASSPKPELKANGESATTVAPAVTPALPAPARDMVANLDASLIQLEPCGKNQCATFPDARSAFSALLDAGPRVVGVGESHVMKGKDYVASATDRFRTELLPELSKRGTSELVVELLKPAPQCEKQVAKVAQKEKQVTEKQAPENKNRFVSLGVAAKEQGIVPFLLEPDCAAYQSIALAKEDSVLKLLEVISSETERRARRFYERQLQREAAGQQPELVVTYGGALHNDIAVDPAKAKFSFGPALVEATGGRYLELDLIVPEFIADTDVWQKLPWYDSFDRSRPHSEATLIRTGPRSFVIIFPHTKAPSAAGSSAGAGSSAAAGSAAAAASARAR